MKAPRSVRRGIPTALLALAALGCASWGIMLLRASRGTKHDARSTTRNEAGRPTVFPASCPSEASRASRFAPERSEACVFAPAVLHCDRRLAAARARVAGRPDDGLAQLRLAGLEFNRAGLLALIAYETRLGARQEEAMELDGQPAGDREGDGYLAWRERFMRGDPDRALTRTSQSARAALRSRLDPDARRLALLLLASARRGLGDYRGEAAALAELTRRDPEVADYWLRLAEAFARARRFARAEAAMGRGLKLLYAQNHPRREASREAGPPAPTRRG